MQRSGVEFPKRSVDAAPIFTPPVTHPTARHSLAGYGMPSNSTRTLDEAMASEMESLRSDFDLCLCFVHAGFFFPFYFL